MNNKILKIYTKIIPGDIETPITLYKKYVGKSRGFLLETKDLDKGRYSFIGKNDGSKISGKGNEVTIVEGLKSETKEGKVLDITREYMNNFKVINKEDFPFVGGVIGSMAYDIIRQYEKIPNGTKDFLDIPDVDFMIVKDFIVYDHLKDQIIIVILDENSKEGEMRADKKISKIEEIISKSDVKINKISQKTLNFNNIAKSNLSKEEYLEMVKKAKEYIVEGDIFQVVLSQRWNVKVEEDPFIIYRRLRSLNPSPYLFYLNFGEYKIVGSSPEMLVNVNKDKVYTCPIAGTRKRGENKEEDDKLALDLIGDEKEKAEHVMLVDLARNDMGRVSKIGSVDVTQFMKVKNYSHVMHLVSLVEGLKEKKKDSFDILPTFLPAGTLSGAPKIRAMEIIEELEKEKRSLYGGAIGYFSFDGNMDTCITIRTMLIKDDIAYMQAGAGIVKDSIPEKEYEETQNKVRALIKVVGRMEE